MENLFAKVIFKNFLSYIISVLSFGVYAWENEHLNGYLLDIV